MLNIERNNLQVEKSHEADPTTQPATPLDKVNPQQPARPPPVEQLPEESEQQTPEAPSTGQQPNEPQALDEEQHLVPWNSKSGRQLHTGLEAAV